MNLVAVAFALLVVIAADFQPASGASRLNKEQIAEGGARLTRRDDRAYGEYVREEQRSQPGRPGREVVLDQPRHATRLIRGDAPRPAPQTVGWEQAVLRVRVSELGVVDRIETLGGTEPLTAALRGAVQQWRFEPAMEGDKAVASQVLVASVYRPPTLHDVPAFRGFSIRPGAVPDQIHLPASMSAPAFPPNALGDGVVLVEVLVGLKGEVRSAAAVQSTASGFNASAVKAALNWRFRPALRQDGPVRAYAYLVFGFRQPFIRTTPVK